MTSEPDTALRWAAGNVGRFLLIWLLVTTAFMVTIDLADGGHLDRPHSVWAILFLPITFAAFLAAVVITALIAMILFSPVVLVWLAVYLSALWWLGRARPHALVQTFAVALAPLLWIVFLQTDPPEVGYAALLVTFLFGIFVRPRNGSPAVAGLPRSHL